MSKSFAIKLTGLGFAAFLTWPSLADGAELRLEEKVWEVQPRSTITPGYVVRNDFDLMTFLTNSYSDSPYKIQSRILDTETLNALNEIATETRKETKSAKLIVVDTWAKEFEPGQDGQALDIYKTHKLLASGQRVVELPVLVSKAGITLPETNNLGINELVATGESDFTGSPYNRRVNIQVGADKFQGLILKPGEEFSFNKILGDVDGENGFLPELVIKRTGTVPEFGGGLCQVSSTAFRAAMNAGLPITARRNHSYAVKYYAPQGTDATIYPGVQDFKFVNDLSSHLLIRTRVEDNKLYYDFYGTKDERKISFDGPYQYDKQANGAMKAVWTRWVEMNGEKKEQKFNSIYQPPALFQTVAQASTPNPESNPNSPQTAGAETSAGEPGENNDENNAEEPENEESAEEENIKKETNKPDKTS